MKVEARKVMNRFVILCHGRTGSTFLVESMSKHEKICVKTELFNRNYERRPDVNGEKWVDGTDSWNFVNRTLFQPANDIGKTAGFKLMYFHAQGDENEKTIWRRVESDPELGLIVLHRSNIFAAYLSNARAREVGLWQPRKGILSDFYSRREIVVDIEAMRKFILLTMERQSEGYRLIEKRGGVMVTYEALFSDPRAELGKVYDYLGVDKNRVEKYPEVLRDSSVGSGNTVVRNDAEVASTLRELGAEWMLERE